VCAILNLACYVSEKFSELTYVGKCCMETLLIREQFKIVKQAGMRF